MPDITLCVYLITAIVASSGSVLFIWWFAVNRFHSSAVYLYVTILLLGEAITSWGNVQGRCLVLSDDGTFLPFTLTWPWQMRSVFTLVGLTAIVLHMSFRVLIGRNPDAREKWGTRINHLVQWFRRDK